MKKPKPKKKVVAKKKRITKLVDPQINCELCGKPIPKMRLKALPSTTTCVKCSQEKPKMGATIWDKTTPELIISNSEEIELIKTMEKMNYSNLK